MKDWEKALDKFLDDWRKKDCVIGAIVCGSYVTGDPSPHSDIDVHIVLSDDVEWRERGNIVVDGYLIEYFVNPPKQIKKYFEEDYNDLRPHSMVQFLTGRIIYDKYDEIEKLKNEAKLWFEKEFKGLSDTSLEFIKYHIWDTQDNLNDCYEQNRSDFQFVYYNSLKILFEQYSRYLRIELIPFYQILKYLSDSRFMDKYLTKPFPDEWFCNKFISSLKANENDKKITLFNELTNHVLEKMGGFNIDGWRIRSSVDK